MIKIFYKAWKVIGRHWPTSILFFTHYTQLKIFKGKDMWNGPHYDCCHLLNWREFILSKWYVIHLYNGQLSPIINLKKVYKARMSNIEEKLSPIKIGTINSYARIGDIHKLLFTHQKLSPSSHHSLVTPPSPIHQP